MWRLLVVLKKQSQMHRLNIVQPSIESRSRSVTGNGSGQSASWQMRVWSFISLEALVFEKQINLKLLMPKSDPYFAHAC